MKSPCFLTTSGKGEPVTRIAKLFFFPGGDDDDDEGDDKAIVLIFTGRTTHTQMTSE